MSKTILLADDSLTIQKVVELTFSDTDFEVIATSSGSELLERLPSSGADIVICDTIMPGLDGYAVCQSIKSESTTLHLPVILMTGTFEPFDRDRALAAGCSEIITKPFEARNLVETVERLITDQGIAAPAPEPFAGSVAPPDFDSVATPPTPDQGASEFGTMLSPPPDAPSEVTPPESGDELDFTSTGFAEMEAAGAEGDAVPDVAPDHGLEFEPSTSEDQEAELLEAAEEPEADPFGAAAHGMFAEPDAAEEPPLPEPEPETLAEPAFEPEPEPFDAEPDTPESTDVDTQPLAEFPIDTDPVVELAPEAEILPEQDDDEIEEMDEALVGGLSDADIDRIARKVVELAADRLEKIAWDVVPDMAEIVVRERIRELEDDIENTAGTTDPN